MTQFEYLPEDLARLFPVENNRIPVVIQDLLTEGWDAMNDGDQRKFIGYLKAKKDPLKRLSLAIDLCVKILLSQPPESTVYLTRGPRSK